MINTPSLSEIDEIRNQGLRPQIVGCFLFAQKILFLFQKKHNLWQWPQGGIDNGESLEEAFSREMKEELGDNFINSNSSNLKIISEDKVLFPSSTQNTRELKNDKGENIFLKGKKYFFAAQKVNNPDLDLKETEFNNYKWLSFEEAKNLANKIYQPGKKRITVKVLDLLKKLELL